MTSNPNTLGVVNSDGSAGSAVAASTSAAVGVMSTSAVGDTSVANASVFAGPIVSGTNANLSVSVFAADPNSNAANNNNSGDIADVPADPNSNIAAAAGDNIAADPADSDDSDSSDDSDDADADDADDADSDDSDGSDGIPLKRFSHAVLNANYSVTVEQLRVIVRSLSRNLDLDHATKVEAMRTLCCNLSTENSEVFRMVLHLQESVIPLLIRMLAESSPLKGLAVCCLSNIAAGTSSRGLVDSEAVPALIELLKSHDNRIKWLAIRALGNIGAGDHVCRQKIIESNGIIPLITLLNKREQFNFKDVNHTLCNIFRKKLPSAVNILVQALIVTFLKPLILECLSPDDDPHNRSADDRTIAKTSLQMLLCFLHTPYLYLSIGTNTYRHVIKFLSIDDLELTLIALHVIKNCTDGSMKKVLRDKHVLTRLRTLLVADNAPVLLLRGEVCEAIFMFTIGEPNYSQDVTGQLLLDVLNVMNDTHDRAIKCSCAKTIFNVTCGGLELIMSLPLQACIQQLCFFFLHTDDVELLHLSLGAILNFCQDGQTKDNIDTIGELIAEYNVGDLIASDRLESLEDTSQDPKIRKLAEDILNQLYLE